MPYATLSEAEVWKAAYVVVEVRVPGWLGDKSLACAQALPPGRVPHVCGLSHTWVEEDGRSPPLSFLQIRVDR